MSVHIARAFTRSSVECIARVQPENAAFFMVVVVELSHCGCRLQTDRSLVSGTRIDLKLPDVPRGASPKLFGAKIATSVAHSLDRSTTSMFGRRWLPQ